MIKNKRVLLFIISIVMLSSFIGGCSKDVQSLGEEFEGLESFTDEKFYAFIENYVDEPRDIETVENLIDSRIDNLDENGQNRLVHYHGYNLNQNTRKYAMILEYYKPTLIKDMMKKDFNEDKYLENLDDKVLKVLLEEIKRNKMFVRYVNDDIYVNTDFTRLKEKYEKYMEEDYIEYYSIMEDIENTNLIENNVIIVDELEKMIEKHKDFLFKHNESSLFPIVSNGFLSHLSLYIGMSNLDILVNEDNTVKPEMLEIYREFSEKNSDNALGKFLNQFLEIVGVPDIEYNQEIEEKVGNLLYSMYDELMMAIYTDGDTEEEKDIEWEDVYIDKDNEVNKDSDDNIEDTEVEEKNPSNE